MTVIRIIDNWLVRAGAYYQDVFPIADSLLNQVSPWAVGLLAHYWHVFAFEPVGSAALVSVIFLWAWMAIHRRI